MTNRQGLHDSSTRELMKELKALSYDLKCLRENLVGCKKDADKGLMEDETARVEGLTLEFRVSYLFGRLADAKHDFDRRMEDVDDIQKNLLDLIEEIEYESIRDAAISKD